MEKYNIRITKKESFQLNRATAFLNYNPADEIFTRPIIQLLTNEGLSYITEKESGNENTLADCALVINIVTDNFLKDSKRADILIKSKKFGLNQVSILFTDEDSERELPLEQFGKTISFSGLEESIDEYLLTSLYGREPFRSLIGNVTDELQAELTPILHESVAASGLKIGNEDSIILAVGSMGYSTINMWLNQGFEIRSKVVFVLKSNDVEKGQPDILPDMNKWILEIENNNKADGAGFIRETHTAVRTWLQDNIQSKKLILVGGLGKTTSSLLIPIILTQAKKLGINTHSICTLPLWFEPSRSKEIADTSFELIRRVSDSIACFENLDVVSMNPDSSITVNDTFSLVSYAIAVVINDHLFKREDYFVGTHHIHVSQKDNYLRDTTDITDTCGTFEVAIT